MKAAVIGSGVGGLAAAVRLARKGYQVTVYEKNDHTGGKISKISGEGFRFDAGPSLFTLPELTDELFEGAGKKTRDYLPYRKLDLICSYFYEDGTIIRAFSDPGAFAKEVEDKTGEPFLNILRHLQKCREQYDLTADIFLFNSLHKIRNYFHPRVLKGLLLFHKVDAFTTMHQRNTRRFSDQRVIQLFDRYATYNGSDPYHAPATLNVIAHLEHNLGAYFPEKGMRSIADALESLAREMGITIRLSSKVDKIVTDRKRVNGLMVRDQFLPHDLVVSDADIRHVYQQLLPGSRPFRGRDQHLSSSALIFYWGIRKEFPKLRLHNILFSHDYEAEFQHIFKERLIYEDPTVYIFISSKEVASDAPVGTENWFVMINVPPDTGQPWGKMIPEARRNIIGKINRMLHTSLEELIEFERIGSPGTIERDTFAWKGALYGNHSNSWNSAFLRHSFRHRTFENLFFVGGSVHPGGGIPLCLASAKIVDGEIKPVHRNPSI
jgi:phytoene desaturase